ncbi:MAG: hypothetical protein K5656_08745 [Lachnospiraceae bacterium]|nr:hypothetical protein [Lachnospiraceae bacterium]
MSDLGGLSGGLGGLDASTLERDKANAKNDDLMYDLNNTASSLSDVATQGMGEGLSAMREGMGMGGDGMELSAGLEDDEPEMEIHAALEDEEVDDTIHAGRSDNMDEPSSFPGSGSSGSSGLSMSTGNKKPAEERSSFDSYNNLANDSRQSIDDIFIAGNMSRSNFGGGGSSSGGGTMYDPSKETTKVNMAFSMPPFIKNLFFFLVFLGVVYAVLRYGFKINVENYFKPVAVESYRDMPAEEAFKALGLSYKTKQDSYTSSSYEYKLDVSYAGGLRLVDYEGKRLYIELTGMRADYTIYGVRPQFTKYQDATNLLIAAGYAELTDQSYENVEELGSQGTEHCFYNSKTGEGVIIGKKDQYDAVKSVKFVKNYKKFRKERTEVRNGY